MTETKNQKRALFEDLPDMGKIAADIRNIRRSAENLQRLGNQFPALSKNAARVLASLTMIELSVIDADPTVSDKR